MIRLFSLLRKWVEPTWRSEREIDEEIARQDAKWTYVMLPESWYEEMELEFPAMSDELGDMDEQLASWMSVR